MKFLVYVLIFINLGILIWGITGQFTSQEHAGQAPLEFGDVKVLSKYDIDLLRTASNRDSLANTALDGDSNSKLPSQADPTVEQQTKTIPSSSVEALIVQDGVSGAEKGESNVEPRQSQTVGGTEVLTQLVAEEARQTVAAAEHRQEGAAGLGLGEADSVAEKMVTPEDTRTFQSPNAANEERGFPTTETLEPESAQFQEHSEPLQLICNVLGPIEDEVLAKAIFREIERQGGGRCLAYRAAQAGDWILGRITYLQRLWWGHRRDKKAEAAGDRGYSALLPGRIEGRCFAGYL